MTEEEHIFEVEELNSGVEKNNLHRIGNKLLTWLPIIISAAAAFFAFGSYDEASNANTLADTANTTAGLALKEAKTANSLAKGANKLSGTANNLSISANDLAKGANDIYNEELRLTHRPYLMCFDLDQTPRTKLYELAKIVINSPARILKEEYHYYTMNDDVIESIHKHSAVKTIVYPHPDFRSIYSLDGKDIEQLEAARQNRKIIYREIKFVYTKLGGVKEYIFETKAKLDVNTSEWALIDKIRAN